MMNKMKLLLLTMMLFSLPGMAYAERVVYASGGTNYSNTGTSTRHIINVVNPSTVRQSVRMRVVTTGQVTVAQCNDGNNAVPVGSDGKECVSRNTLMGLDPGEALNMVFYISSVGKFPSSLFDGFYVEITVLSDDGFVLATLNSLSTGVLHINQGRPF